MSPPNKIWIYEAAKKAKNSVLADHFEKLMTKRRRGRTKNVLGDSIVMSSRCKISRLLHILTTPVL